MYRALPSIDGSVYRTPSPSAVARLVDSHGLEAAAMRWHWMGTRTLCTMARQARAAAGCASTISRARSYSDEGAAVCCESAFVLGSLRRGERAAGFTAENVGRGIVQARGLTPPRITAEERGRAASIGHAANGGDGAAIAERDARHAQERAVGEVLRRALRLVPSQPATGRYSLPPCGDALRAALAGLPAEAVALVFPSLAAPEEILVPEKNVRPRRRATDEATIRADHATGATGVTLATRYGISASRVYEIWRELGLPALGRSRPGPKPDAAPVQAAASSQLPPDIQMISCFTQGWQAKDLAVALDVTPDVIVAIWRRLGLLPDDRLARPGPIPTASVRLSVEDLAVAVALAARPGISPAMAVEAVAADRGRIAALRRGPVVVVTPEERALAERAYAELLADWDAPDRQQ